MSGKRSYRMAFQRDWTLLCADCAHDRARREGLSSLDEDLSWRRVSFSGAAGRSCGVCGRELVPGVVPGWPGDR
jgi:hypothetical protein